MAALTDGGFGSRFHSETHVESPVAVFILSAASIVCFSAMNVFVKLASADYSIAQTVFFRSALAFIPVAVMVYFHGGVRILKTQAGWGHAWRGVLGMSAMVCFFTSFALLPLADATAIHFTSPLMLTALSVPLLAERVGPHRWGAVVFGMAAVLFMIYPETGGDGNAAGSLVALGAAFLGAVAGIAVRKLGRTEHAVTIVFYFTLCGTLLGGAALPFMWRPLQAGTFAGLLAMGILGGIGQILQTHAYSKAPAAYVAPFTYLSMFFAALGDILIWGKWPGWHVWAGSAAIMASGLYIVYREARKKRLTVGTGPYDLPPSQPTEIDEKKPV